MNEQLRVTGKEVLQLRRSIAHGAERIALLELLGLLGCILVGGLRLEATPYHLRVTTYDLRRKNTR